MFVGIANTPRDYAWGSTGEISGLLGLEASGRPEAELWLGAHAGSPSRVVGTGETLVDVVGGRLPFLLKVLAAGSPLSLQAHPTPALAAEGFARENALGIPLDAPERNYKDAFHKPELIYAVGEMRALCGFRPVADIRMLLQEHLPAAAALLDRLHDDDSLRGVFEWLITRGDGVDDLIATVVEHAGGAAQELATVRELAAAYPGDPGIVISLLLNNVTLAPGEVLYLPAGNIHAYQRGLGIELMASSDNVLRGGLTPKHVDLPELLAALDFTPVPVPYLAAEHPSPGVSVFRPDVPDFLLAVIDDEGRYELTGPAIALCTEGDLEIVGARGAYNVSRGDAVYITPDEASLSVGGLGRLFLATVNG